MNSAQFQGSAKSTPFAPQQAYDPTPAMREQLQDQLRWMREDQQMVIEDRRRYAAALDRQMRMNQSVRETDLENLASMSKTLTDTLLQVKKDRNQAQQEEGLMLAYEYGIPLQQAQQFDQSEKELTKARDATNEFAGRQAKNGAPPEIVEKIRNLSGWRKYGYLVGLAQQSGMKWGEYLDNALQNDNETQIDLGNGQIITPAQAKDKAEIAAAATVLRKSFIREQGLIGANPALLNKYLFPNMKQGEENVISQRYGALVSAKARELIDEQDGILTRGLQSQGNAGESFNAYVSNLSSVIDPQTKTLLGFGGSRDRALGVIEALAKDGQLDESAIAQIEQTLIPGSTTETWGWKFGQKFVGLRDAIRAGKEADFAAQEREDARADEQRVKELIALSEQKGGFTDAEKEQIRSSYQAAGKLLPTQLEGLLTVEQKDDRAAKDYLDGLIAQGRGISEYELRSSGYSNKVILDYLPKVRQYEQNVLNNSEFKAGVKTLSSLLYNNTLGDSATGTRPNWTLGLAQAQAESILRAETLKNVQTGMDPAAAARAAVAEVSRLIAEGRPSSKGPGTGPFAVETDPGNQNVARVNGQYIGALLGLGKDRRNAAQREAQFNQLVQRFQQLRQRAVDTPGFISSTDLQQLERVRRDPSSQFPSSVLWLSRETKLSPWDIADRQLKAAGRQPLTRPPEVQWRDTIQDPRLQRLLDFSPSYNRTQRAFSGTTWNPAKVPNGWGRWVDQAARQYGIDPALLAGLLKHESAGWNPNARSSAGALGLAQITDDTLAEAGISSQDRLNPQKAIFAAAKIFSGRLRAVNGDINLALRAYNMGLAGATRNPGGYPGDSESQQFPSKVLREAAAYGYGFGPGSPFRRPDTMNPRLAYKIGNLGYGSTGPHLDVKPVRSGSLQTDRNLSPYREGMLDQYVLVKVNGKLVPLSKGAPTSITSSGERSDERSHRARGSFGHDHAAPDGTEVYLRNGARVVGTFKGDQGTDHTIIELPDGRRFQFLHGRNA